MLVRGDQQHPAAVWPAWAWAAVPLFGLAARVAALFAGTLLYVLGLELAGEREPHLWGFLFGPLLFLWAAWAGQRAAVAGWRWTARPAAGTGVEPAITPDRGSV